MDLESQTEDTLWTLIATPTIWAGHFLFCYILAAVDCAPNTAIFETIEETRIAVAAVSALCLLAIGLLGFRSYREWRFNQGSFPHDEDTPEDRERFMEFSSLLLAALSFVAVIFVALPAFVFVDCR